MKKFIFVFVVFLCAAMSVSASDVTYTSWGNGLELVTGNNFGVPEYGLRKNGVELIPVRCKLIVSEELNVAVFYRTDASGMFSVYGCFYFDIYDLSTGRHIAKDKIKLTRGDARLTYGTHYLDEYVSVLLRPRMIGGKKAYTLHLVDKTGEGRYAEKDLIILGLVNGKLCKYVPALKPVVI